MTLTTDPPRLTPPTQQTHPPLRSTASQLRFPMLRTIMALILREMAATHGRSPGGYIWMVLEPVLGIALLTVVFSAGFRTPPIGSNFAIFYATGILPFSLYTDLSNKIAQSINYSRALLSYPRVTFIDTIIARLTLTVLTQCLVHFLILTGIRSFADTRTSLEFSRLLMSYAMVISLAIGIGLLNCYLMTRFPLYQRAWGIMMRPLFLLSGVILLYENMPRRVQEILWFNPLQHAIGEMRAAFYVQYHATYVTPVYVFGVAAVLGLTGIIFLRRYHRDMLEQ